MKKEKQKSFSTVETKSFITVVIVLTAVILLCGALSYFIPQGSFERDESGNIILGTYTEGAVDGIAIWRVLTAPVRVFASSDEQTSTTHQAPLKRGLDSPNQSFKNGG